MYVHAWKACRQVTATQFRSSIMDGPWSLCYVVGADTRPMAGPIFTFDMPTAAINWAHGMGEIRAKQDLPDDSAILYGHGEPWIARPEEVHDALDELCGAILATTSDWGHLQECVRARRRGACMSWPDRTLMLANFVVDGVFEWTW